MTILIDASALVAIVTREPEAAAFARVIEDHSTRLCCAIGIWEAARAIARSRRITVSEAASALQRLQADLDLRVVPIGANEANLALDAHDRFGKGTGHPARLNMGDCFAYACAKANDARLLYKGDDFTMTDMAL